MYNKYSIIPNQKKIYNGYNFQPFHFYHPSHITKIQHLRLHHFFWYFKIRKKTKEISFEVNLADIEQISSNIGLN